jgi:hypothetical protein
MKKRIYCCILTVALALLFASPQAMAEGKGKKGAAGTPAGWEKGKKKGWEGDAPPKHDKEATEAISEKAEEEAAELDKETKEKAKNKSKKSKERTEKEDEDAKKSIEKDQEKTEEE